MVPKSVVGNWIREFKNWCPAIKAAKMLATKEERKQFVETMLPIDPKTGKHKFDVLVTSYEGILRAKSALGKVNWKYVIIDEAHRYVRIASADNIISDDVHATLCSKTLHALLFFVTAMQN